MKIYFLSILILFGIVTSASSHGGKKHKKDSTAHADSLKQGHEALTQGDTVHHHDEGMKVDESKVAAELSDFPSMHPLIVHFAIVLIIVAAALQLLNIFLLKDLLSWIIGALLFVGFAAAWLASGKFHPHTHGISEHAKLVLEQHDKWADWTKYSAAIALLFQVAFLIFLFFKSRRTVGMVTQDADTLFLRTKRFATIVIGIVLLISAYSVIHAGHYGAQLVHIEGIGPGGKFLEMEHHH